MNCRLERFSPVLNKCFLFLSMEFLERKKNKTIMEKKPQMSKELKREIQYKLSFNYMQYLNHARSKSN